MTEKINIRGKIKQFVGSHIPNGFKVLDVDVFNFSRQLAIPIESPDKTFGYICRVDLPTSLGNYEFNGEAIDSVLVDLEMKLKNFSGCEKMMAAK